MLVLALLWSPASAKASECATLAAQAEEMFEIPRWILQAVVMTESSNHPYALNVDGQAFYPATKTEASALLHNHLESADNIDVGCGQISLRHHPHYFRDMPDLALDPWFNIVYAAKFLIENKLRFGTWTEAVAHYHSGNAERRHAYVCRVARNLTILAGQKGAHVEEC
ncbi:lytic transglycosylase domain-containing protein [Telmatospirillum sp. J64-1]|uniref:lytic transglycosylase domain-containing protein n=1 Tax=Telmatospirillum sp. J64-1 TaxID=2502183 RepID=UPI00163D454E|nr:lytic transglycosylase domain-containing protein [Telmatospirillum sp. J64-1]